MGRKIPGRKHHGVRDPEKQKQQRFALIKDKIDAPPANSDEQQVPKSLTRLIDLKNKVKTGVISLKSTRKRKKGLKPVTSHPFGVKSPKGNEKPIPVFEQGKNESDERFLHRVNRICHNVLQEAKFEDKYGVEIKRNTLTGEVEVVKRKRDEIEEYHKKVRKEMKNKGDKKKKKKKGEENNGPKLTKSQKRSVKLKAKKEKLKDLKFDEFKNYEDNVKFGEVVHAPPSLVIPKKAQNNEDTQRPGKRNLLLKALVGGTGQNSKDHIKTEHRVIDKKGKRKDLPTAMRRQLDKQQQEVIQAYKLLKAKKYGKE